MVKLRVLHHRWRNINVTYKQGIKWSWIVEYDLCGSYSHNIYIYIYLYSRGSASLYTVGLWFVLSFPMKYVLYLSQRQWSRGTKPEDDRDSDRLCHVQPSHKLSGNFSTLSDWMHSWSWVLRYSICMYFATFLTKPTRDAMLFTAGGWALKKNTVSCAESKGILPIAQAISTIAQNFEKMSQWAKPESWLEHGLA